MKIGIEINDTLRSYSTQLQEVINKYHYKDFDIEKKPIRGPFWEYFEFESEVAFNEFIYGEAGLEIFGHPDVMSENSVPNFNLTNSIIEEYEDHQLYIVGRESMMAIPGTLFFLAKIAAKIRHIIFVKTYDEIWHDVDVIITANPVTLDNKPSYKKSIKINTSYNTGVSADYSVDSLDDILSELENSEGFFKQ
jgi:hypothetical protein